MNFFLNENFYQTKKELVHVTENFTVFNRSADILQSDQHITNVHSGCTRTYLD